MKPRAVEKTLTHLVKIKQPTFLWGPPGVGKSMITAKVAKKIGDFIDMRLVQMDIIDLRGVLTIQGGKAVWAPPAILPTKGKGVLFLDEFVQALMLMQNTASQLILDRCIGEYILPDGWAIVAAGNRETDRAGTNKMPSHLANRFTHITVEVDYEDWRVWAVENKVNAMIRAFLGFRPALLHQFNPAEKAFPTPRSWSYVDKILGNGLDDEIELLEVISGTVGEGAAKEFIGFIRIFRELPDYAEIKKNPKGMVVPTNAGALYAVATMLPEFITKPDLKQVFQFVERLPEDFQVIMVNNLVQKKPEMQETSTYIAWAAEHQSLLLNR